MISQLSFNVNAAKLHGVEGAVLLSHIVYWVYRNTHNNRNTIGGKTWTYNSAQSFAKLFPFWNSQKIRRLLKKLEDENAIIVGCHNKAKYDRTKWFALTNQTLSLYGTDFSDMNNANIKNEQSIIQNETMESSEVKDQYHITNQLTNQITTKKEIVLPFDDPLFLEAWNLWKDERKQKKIKKYTPRGEQGALYLLAEQSENNMEEAIAMINNAISRGWQGIYPRKNDKRTNNKKFDNDKYLAHLDSL